MPTQSKTKESVVVDGSSERKVVIISQVATAAAGVAGSMTTSDATKTRSDKKTSMVPVSQTVTEISFDAFAANIDSTTTTLSQLFQTAFAKTFGDYELNEVEIDLQISADGKVGFMGTGIGVKGSSNFKLKLKKKTQPDSLP